MTCAKDGHRRVYGYYSLSASLVKFDQIPRELVKRYPKLDLPMIHIGRFAIDKTIQGQGRGGELLIHCLLQANAAAENIGAFGVELIARTSEAVGFYEHMGFTKIPLTNNQTYMFLPMATITKLYLDTSATNARKHNT
ncbi:MAG: GNAT family N-acetyltransferase [Phycisphaerales bacterium]|nr:GNAT family N-acetyltransferase [Phycisphaerales bacterium]